MKALLHLLLGTTLAAVLAVGAPTAQAQEKAKPRDVDVVICIDTSNSMDGLIGSAKTKLWDIVNDLAKIKPTPNLRVALYSYGNDTYSKDNGWIRKDVDLTTDLDLLSQKLFALTTRGGTEYHTRVCRDAIEQQKWSADKDALRLLFVCGNEHAAQCPIVKIKDVSELGKKKNVSIAPIFCGNATQNDASDWKEWAALLETSLVTINQDRGTVVIATPQDKELTDLNKKLNETYIAYGKKGERDEKKDNQVKQDANAAQQGNLAGRVATKGGAVYRNSDWDLVDKIKEDPKFDVKKVPVDELCDEMKKMTPEEREKHVKDMLAKREALQKEIGAVSAKRAAHIKEEEKKTPSAADKAFDEAIRAVLKEKAKAKGITIPD